MSTTHDIHGKESSKRKWASRLLWNAIIQTWICLIIWGYITITDDKTINFPEILILPPFIAGLSALGLTIAEYKGLNSNTTV